MIYTFSLLKIFYAYQKTRFPVVILLFSLLPATLSSSAVTGNLSLIKIATALLASILYLLHIRISDEYRDFKHDNRYHPSRPIQKGIISLSDLGKVDILSITFVISIALFSNWYALGLTLILLFYTYIAKHEFFLGSKLKKHFFVYNAINLIQMLLLQILVYTLFLSHLSFTSPLAIHYVFTCLGTIIFEFLRKVKIPGRDGVGKDTYTWFLGFNRAIIIYCILLIVSAGVFNQMILLITENPTFWFFITLGLLLIALCITLFHWIRRTARTDQIMQLSYMLLYGIFNIVIYFQYSTKL